MKKKRIICWVAVIVIPWALTLGVHSATFVRAYCQGDEAYDQPKVYVLMNPQYYTAGVPWLHTQRRDLLPYPLGILVTVDDRFPGQGAVIESMEVEYDDGDKAVIIEPKYARGGPFRVFEPVESGKVPGRTFRCARIDVTKAIWRRGSFKMVIKGYVYGDKDVPFERRLRMDYSTENRLVIGWILLALSTL
ncbi:MAG: hypothetical protein QGG42_17315 [Phycisphaerae bacterium]|nr:hypothetical protein [Phycisphaerae bacterium]